MDSWEYFHLLIVEMGDLSNVNLFLHLCSKFWEDVRNRLDDTQICFHVSILLCWWLDQRITCTRGQTRRPSFHQSTGNNTSLEPGTQKFYCPSWNGCPSLLWCHLCHLLYQIKSSSTFFSWTVNGHCVAQRLKFKITYI